MLHNQGSHPHAVLEVFIMPVLQPKLVVLQIHNHYYTSDFEFA